MAEIFLNNLFQNLFIYSTGTPGDFQKYSQKERKISNSYFIIDYLKEGGVAALRVLKCSQGFEVKCANVSDLYEKSFKKGTLKQKIEKWPLLPIFYCL